MNYNRLFFATILIFGLASCCNPKDPKCVNAYGGLSPTSTIPTSTITIPTPDPQATPQYVVITDLYSPSKFGCPTVHPVKTITSDKKDDMWPCGYKLIYCVTKDGIEIAQTDGFIQYYDSAVAIKDGMLFVASGVSPLSTIDTRTLPWAVKTATP